MGSAAKPVVCIVTPGTKTANNGNWRTAARWALMLRDRFKVIVQTEWDASSCDAMIALHARRSAASIAACHATGGPLAVVLTGTDLYKDLPESEPAAHSLDLADAIVVLQDEAPRRLEPRWRRKTQVIFQSAPAIDSPRKKPDRLDCVMVGHLRAEKDPLTVFRAFARLPRELPIRLRHIGAPLDPDLGNAARELAARDARYVYAGPLSHAATRRAMARAHLLIHSSLVEGGANVIVEAIMAGTAVVASRIPGNVGMLGRDYGGYFPPGNESALAGRLVQALEDRRYLAALEAACRSRRKLFSPAAESRAVNRLARSLVSQGRR